METIYENQLWKPKYENQLYESIKTVLYTVLYYSSMKSIVPKYYGYISIFLYFYISIFLYFYKSIVVVLEAVFFASLEQITG